MIEPSIEELLASSPSLPALPPWQELERIDQTVGHIAARLQEAPWLLPRLLPSMVVLARKRSSRWRAWFEAGDSCSVAELRARFEPPAPGMARFAPEETQAPEPAEETPDPETFAAQEAPDLDAPAETTPGGLESVAAAANEAEVEHERGPAPARQLEARALATMAGEAPGAAMAGAQPRAVEQVAEEVSAELLIRSTAAQPAVVGREQLQAFTQNFGKRRLSSPLVHQRDPRLCQREDLVREVLARLGTLPTRLEFKQALALGDLLETLTNERWLQRWTVLDAPLQVDLLTLMVALARSVQEVCGTLLDLKGLFARLSAYSLREQPGFTHGMARNHKPARGTWLKEAFHAHQTLRRWLGEDSSPEAAGASSRAPSAPVAAAVGKEKAKASSAEEAPAEEAPAESDAEPSVLVEESWSCWPQVRSRRAVLVGGSPREQGRRRLEAAFQLASLEWVDGDVRRVDSVAERVRHGGLDLVLVVRDFISHKASRKVVRACKTNGVLCVLVEHGHGVLAVRRSIERCLHAGES